MDLRRARDFGSTAESDRISPTGPISYGWIARDLNQHGTVGDASQASAEKGKAVAFHQVSGFIALLRDVTEKRLDGFAPATCPA